METDGQNLRMAECKEDEPNQKWVWKEIYINA